MNIVKRWTTLERDDVPFVDPEALEEGLRQEASPRFCAGLVQRPWTLEEREASLEQQGRLGEAVVDLS